MSETPEVQNLNINILLEAQIKANKVPVLALIGEVDPAKAGVDRLNGLMPNLKRIIAGGRLPGYGKHAAHMSPEEYAKRVIWGDFYDPVLRFQLDEGFDYCGILHGYLPTDPESIGNAALIVWLNRYYDADQPTRLPPPDFLENPQ